jgi:hypothetical protein
MSIARRLGSAYGLADAGNGTIVSLSMWDHARRGRAAAPVAAAWVRDNVADRVRLTSNTVADLAFLAGAALVTA